MLSVVRVVPFCWQLAALYHDDQRKLCDIQIVYRQAGIQENDAVS